MKAIYSIYYILHIPYEKNHNSSINNYYSSNIFGLKQKKSAEFSIKTALILIKVWYNFVVLKLTLKYAKNTVQNVEIKK